jgi:DNA-binding transcriptional MerR regulator
MKSAQSHLGVGLYSFAEAARLIGVHPRRIHRWLSEPDLAPMVFERSEHTITFQQLMELHFIKMFREAGVSLNVIRRASVEAAKKFDSAYPFSVKRFDTDGHRIFATLIEQGGKKPVLEELHHGQTAFLNICKPFFKKLDYRSSKELLRYWPRHRSGRVVMDRARKFGKPIDADTGVPTAVIYDAVKAGGGQSHEDVARWLGIPIAAIRKAVDFERSLAA